MTSKKDGLPVSYLCVIHHQIVEFPVNVLGIGMHFTFGKGVFGLFESLLNNYRLSRKIECSVLVMFDLPKLW